MTPRDPAYQAEVKRRRRYLFAQIVKSAKKRTPIPEYAVISTKLLVSFSTIHRDFEALERDGKIRTLNPNTSDRIYEIVATGEKTPDIFERAGLKCYDEIKADCIKLIGTHERLTAYAFRRRMGVGDRIADRLLLYLHEDGLVERTFSTVPTRITLTDEGREMVGRPPALADAPPKSIVPPSSPERPPNGDSDDLLRMRPLAPGLAVRTCRFIAAHVADIPLDDLPNAFCGAPVKPGSSWCPEHHERCMTKFTPRSGRHHDAEPRAA